MSLILILISLILIILSQFFQTLQINILGKTLTLNIPRFLGESIIEYSFIQLEGLKVNKTYVVCMLLLIVILPFFAIWELFDLKWTGTIALIVTFLNIIIFTIAMRQLCEKIKLLSAAKLWKTILILIIVFWIVPLITIYIIVIFDPQTLENASPGFGFMAGFFILYPGIRIIDAMFMMISKPWY